MPLPAPPLRPLLPALLGLLLALGPTAAPAAESLGTFRTQPNDQGQTGLVEFRDCGGRLCGRLVRSFDASGHEIASKNIGRDIVAGMTDQGGGRFGGGTIWDPGSDRTYRSKMRLEGDRLSVSGCVAVFCKSQVWTRAR
jgi:uncharacterized protein (DUF2147 family)